MYGRIVCLSMSWNMWAFLPYSIPVISIFPANCRMFQNHMSSHTPHSQANDWILSQDLLSGDRGTEEITVNPITSQLPISLPSICSSSQLSPCCSKNRWRWLTPSVARSEKQMNHVEWNMWTRHSISWCLSFSYNSRQRPEKRNDVAKPMILVLLICFQHCLLFSQIQTWRISE